MRRGLSGRVGGPHRPKAVRHPSRPATPRPVVSPLDRAVRIEVAHRPVAGPLPLALVRRTTESDPVCTNPGHAEPRTLGTQTALRAAAEAAEVLVMDLVGQPERPGAVVKNSRPLARAGGRRWQYSVPSAGAQRRPRLQRPWFLVCLRDELSTTVPVARPVKSTQKAIVRFALNCSPLLNVGAPAPRSYVKSKYLSAVNGIRSVPSRR